jgi:nitrogen fixation protein NifX
MQAQRHLRLLDAHTDDAPMQDAPRVAFATSDMRSVDQHFGAAAAFAVYALGADQARLVEVAQFQVEGMDGNEDKLAGRIAALRDCVAVYTNAVGASAIAQLKLAGVQPVKVPPGTAIPGVIEALRDELDGEGDGWLARALQSRADKDPARFADMAAEDWVE